MRVRSPLTELEIAPGQTAQITLEVVNTSDVIESATVAVLGIDAATITSQPSALALFPEAAGELTVSVTLPEAFPAGNYPLSLVVSGTSENARKGHHQLELTVPRRPALRLTASPSVVRARRKASFPVVVHNDGNVVLETALRASDADRRLRTQIVPSTITVPPGSSAQVTAVVRGPRQLVGADRERPLTLHAYGVDSTAEITLTLQQRSTFSRGLLTALTLLGIMALWVVAFIIGIRFVLGGDPFAKVAPASFFAGQTVTGAGDAASGAAPDGALAKDGAVPAAVGATISGSVTSIWDGSGVSRLTVDVLRSGRKGLQVVASTATLGDGTYSVAGLFPGNYLVRVTGVGYDTVWYPSGSNLESADAVAAVSQKTMENVDLQVEGTPSTLRGKVLTGTSEATTPITVTATPSWSAGTSSAARTTTADGDGNYEFTDLPSPASYQLSFAAEGFRTTSSTERVLGGQDRYALDVTLGAGTGSISGIVTDGTDPIGAVTVSTTVADETLTVGTPTIGLVGSFTFSNLPTPATYVLTFTKDGYTTRSTVVDLEAGQSLTDLEVQLAGGAGTVTGKVTAPGGAGVGDVTVSVGGSATPITTTTLTGSNAGAFTLTGLVTPGQYTITFLADGYLPASVPVTLTVDEPSTTIPVRLSRSLGTIAGRVTASGTGKAGVTVQITDGEAVRTTTSTASGDYGRGTYSFDDLPAGIYTVTARTDGGRVIATTVVTLAAGTTERSDLPITEGS
ncbi:hypothetical protein GCM10010401_12970 [Rarobacter faecitabidus]|uniref:alpha-amylase n=1 Tax=Rarobacter faecitabidus TaxID=13243 RepID=A0A542ZE84_RARFA|nr:carboxypeptidase regulatory-like domain-containing protein [Rarobacter faecitabidus]TQL58654.1 carboxypeptidase family protein [Rarobacter faecitabidus]